MSQFLNCGSNYLNRCEYIQCWRPEGSEWTQHQHNDCFIYNVDLCIMSPLQTLYGKQIVPRELQSILNFRINLKSGVTSLRFSPTGSGETGQSLVPASKKPSTLTTKLSKATGLACSGMGQSQPSSCWTWISSRKFRSQTTITSQI